MTNTHRWLLRVSRGHLGGRVLGMDTVELHTTGRRSGKPRSTLLSAPVHEDGQVVLVASRGGADAHPAWYLNLRAQPEVHLTIRGRTLTYRARTATREERDDLWPRIVRANPGYAGYQQRTRREIPVVICEPVAET